MTTKDKAVVGNRDYQGGAIKNWRLQELASDPATTYPRIYYNTVSFKIRYYDTDAAAWADLGAGSGSVEAITGTSGKIVVDATDPANPDLDVDESALAVPQANVTDLVDDLALLAPLASPALTGTPTAPTASGTDNSTQIATTAQVQAALAAYIAAQDVLVFKGGIDCSTNPNYPAADAGHVYKVSVAGKIGGVSGPNVEVGDVLTCTVDSSSSGDHATVGSSWIISQVNIDGAVTGPVSATSGNLASYNGTTGKIVQDSGVVASQVVRGYTALIGNGSTEDITINHARNGYPCGVEFMLVSTGEVLDVYWEYVDANNIKAYFPTGAPPASNAIRVAIAVI